VIKIVSILCFVSLQCAVNMTFSRAIAFLNVKILYNLVRFGQIRVYKAQCVLIYHVILQTFVNQFQVAKDQVTAAGAVVADRATAAAQDISTQATRVSLKVGLKAPVIIIPQNSQSSNAVVVDLGQLTVSNALQLASAGQKSADGLPPVLDLMSVELDKLMLSRYSFTSFHHFLVFSEKNLMV